MKFGKQFAFYKIPEWSEYYLDYAAIKTVLKFIDNRKNKKKGLKKLKKLKRRLSKIDPEEVAMAVQNYYKELKENENLLKENNKKEQMIKNIEDLSEFTNTQKLNYFIEFYKSKIKIVEDFFILSIKFSVYPKYMYYFAIVIDMILRFSWITNFFEWYIDDEWKNFILAILEAYRRIQWCVFRIENENTNNPEKYRTILAIPELPVD